MAFCFRSSQVAAMQPETEEFLNLMLWSADLLVIQAGHRFVDYGSDAFPSMAGSSAGCSNFMASLSLCWRRRSLRSSASP